VPTVMNPTALDGLLVLDLSRAYAGPFCGMILADLGARVIKVEQPDGGDFARILPPFGQGPPGENSAYFSALNRNKLSITLNLKDTKGREIFEELATHADVVIENFTPGVLNRLGLGWERLHKLAPRLILASLTCYGQDGPSAQRPGYDGVGQSMGGICSVNGPADAPPTRVGPPIGDSVCGLYAAIGILAAVAARARTGEGQWVDVSQQDAIFSLLESALATVLLTGQALERNGSRHPYVSPYDIFPCKDGYVFFAGYLDHHFRRTCEIFGEPEVADHPDLATLALRSRKETCDRLIYPKLTEWFGRYTKRGLEKLCAEEIPLCPVLNLKECAEDPQLRHRRMIEEVDHPHMGRVRVPGAVIKLSESPTGVRGPAPTLGEHNTEIYGELLGLSAPQVDELRRDKVI
jgi:CoA:oxalate CoA-transferase